MHSHATKAGVRGVQPHSATLSWARSVTITLHPLSGKCRCNLSSGPREISQHRLVIVLQCCTHWIPITVTTAKWLTRAKVCKTPSTTISLRDVRKCNYTISSTPRGSVLSPRDNHLNGKKATHNSLTKLLLPTWRFITSQINWFFLRSY